MSAFHFCLKSCRRGAACDTFTFEEFVRNPDAMLTLSTMSPRHWEPFISNFASRDGRLLPHFLCRLESFESDIREALHVYQGVLNGTVRALPRYDASGNRMLEAVDLRTFSDERRTDQYAQVEGLLKKVHNG